MKIYDDYFFFLKQRGYHQRLLWKACFERNIRVVDCSSNPRVLKWCAVSDNKSITFLKSMPFLTSRETRRVTNDKSLTKKILQDQGVRVPAGKKFNVEELDVATQWYKENSDRPLVVKPISGSSGRGVVTNIKNADEFFYAVSKITKKQFIVEEHVEGSDYRVLVVNGRFVAAMHRLPAHVTGDGESSIETLVNVKNKSRKSNPHTGRYPIRLSELDIVRLERSGLSLSSIPSPGECIFFRTVANVGSGGDSIDVTDNVHDSFKELSIKAYHAFPDMAYCGVDILAQDISKPAHEQSHAVIEINANADIGFHHFPTHGEPRDVAGALIESLFPNSPMADKLPRKITFHGVFSDKFKTRFIKLAGRHAVVLKEMEFSKSQISVKAVGSQVSLDTFVDIMHVPSGYSRVKWVEVLE